MKLCDVNVWLALTLSRHGHHRSARRWFNSVTQPGSVVLCRATQQALLRLLTNRVVLQAFGNAPLSNAAAWRISETILTDDRVVFWRDEPPNLERRWKKFALRDTASPKLWMDAYLAAFATSGRMQLITTDGAFRQFTGLDLEVIEAT